MTRALIGHTGFVGSNLMRSASFGATFNSSNYRDMIGQSFEEVVCAGISAVKWMADKEPERDWDQIQALLDVLATVDAKRFTLISTIDVYADPSREDDERTELPIEVGQPYGRHRLRIEQFITRRFSNVLVARLPALFGPGLKKNVLFDLLHDNQTDTINPRAAFQWYPVERLSRDLDQARRLKIPLVNFFPEPIETEVIVDTLFPSAKIGAPTTPAPRYALRTRYADLFGGRDGYLMDRNAVVEAMRRFVEAERSAARRGA